MKQLYYNESIDGSVLLEKTIAVLGYGSQGHAHALNLRESGYHVVVGLYEKAPSRERALRDGFEVLTVSEAVKCADGVVMLLPDEKQKQVYEADVKEYLKPGSFLMFAHGFNIHYDQIMPEADVDVLLVAPKGPGHLVRSVYAEGKGVPALFAVHQDATGSGRAKALAYAVGIGAGRAGILETTFKEETETDLFGEQAVLCGGLTELIKTGFDVLVEEGYQPEVAYFECLHEMKLIIDLLYEGGFEKMRYSISDTAEYGDYVSGKRVITTDTKIAMQQVLSEIQDGTFATRWIDENKRGRGQFDLFRQQALEHPIVETGKHLRGMMSWIKKEAH